MLPSVIHTLILLVCEVDADLMPLAGLEYTLRKFIRLCTDC